MRSNPHGDGEEEKGRGLSKSLQEETGRLTVKFASHS